MRFAIRLLVLLGVLTSPARADDIVVFAAASLQTALDEVAMEFTALSGHKVAVSYAGSSQLARQIALGAPADIFISANAAWMDALAAEGHLAPGSRAALLGNNLVLVAPDVTAEPVDLTSPTEILERLGSGRLAMALTDAVPAGIYGRAALEAFGLWDSVAAQVAQTDNVRAALALVATGAAPLGLVYRSDAIAEPRVGVVATFPDNSHPPIVYPAAAIAHQAHTATPAFLAHLNAPAARAIFEAQGFIWRGG